MKTSNNYSQKSKNSLSNDEITKTLQIGRLAESGIAVLEPYIKKVSENPKLRKLKIGELYTQHIAQVKRLYNVLNDEKELYEQGELFSEAVCFHNIINNNEKSIGVTLDQIINDEKVFDSIIANENPQKIKEKAKIAQDNLKKLYNYMNKTGISAIVNDQ